MIGWEAFLTLRYYEGDSGVLEEPAAGLLAEYIDRMDAASLLEAMRRISERLRQMTGSTEEECESWVPEKIVITEDYRILIPGRYDMEIRMRPLVKTVFLLFLNHPEGIRFRELGLYRDEMMKYYLGISRRGDAESLSKSIDRLIDPDDNSINEKVSVLTETLSRYFPGPSAIPYSVTGAAGTPKRIALDRYYVEWSNGTKKGRP